MTCVDPHSIGGQHPTKIYLESASMDDLADVTTMRAESGER